MITPEEKEAIVKLLGYRYNPVIQAYMAKKNIHNSNGLLYSSSHITNVMNGRFGNNEIESAIFELCEVKKNYMSDMTQKRKLLLK